MALDKYVNQLILDIKAAQRPPVVAEFEPIDDDAAFLKHIQEVEEYLEGPSTYAPTFGEVCGLKRIQFPPSEQLKEAQLLRLCHHFTRLLDSFNIYYSLPDELPVKMKYDTILTLLDQQITIVEEGHIGVEFCDYEPDNCQFGEHCDCHKFLLDDDDFDMNSGREFDEDYFIPPDLDGDDLPF